MTEPYFPVTVKHAVGGALVRYTKVPAVYVDPVDPGDPDPPPPPPPPSSETIYGYNQNDDTTYQTIAGRKLKLGGRNPCPRVYTGATGHPATFSVSSAIMTEKRVCWSFKADPGGTMTSSYLATNTAKTAKYIPWLESIPAGIEVFWCYHHEVNGGGVLEIPLANYLDTFDRMMEAKAAATLNTGVKVHVVANFMDYQVRVSGKWSDTWVPNCDILTWDTYGNPGQNTSATLKNKYGTPTGTAYNSSYPLVPDRLKDLFAVTEDTGYADSWGVLEVNTPLRNWDVGEVGRVAWHKDWLTYVQDPPMVGGTPPKIVLLWEAPSGVNWVQGYGYNDSASLDSRWAGGTIKYSSTKADNSPLWDVWKPYIVGTSRLG